MPSTSTFTSFPKLPPELRVQVWELAISEIEPKIIRLRCWLKEADCLKTSKWFSATSERVPAVMHACRESREEGLQVYDEMSFGVYMNTDIDTLFFEGDRASYRSWDGSEVPSSVRGEHDLFAYLPPDGPSFSKLRSLAIDFNTLMKIFSTGAGYHLMRRFDAIQNLNIIGQEFPTPEGKAALRRQRYKDAVAYVVERQHDPPAQIPARIIEGFRRPVPELDSPPSKLDSVKFTPPQYPRPYMPFSTHPDRIKQKIFRDLRHQQNVIDPSTDIANYREKLEQLRISLMDIEI